MNIYQVNEIDWVVSKNESEAIKNYNKIVSDDSPVKRIDKIRLLSNSELEQNQLCNDETQESCSFKEALKQSKKTRVFRKY